MIKEICTYLDVIIPAYRENRLPKNVRASSNGRHSNDGDCLRSLVFYEILATSQAHRNTKKENVKKMCIHESPSKLLNPNFLPFYNLCIRGPVISFDRPSSGI